MKNGTNRLITERYITNTERSVGNLSYICPLPLGFKYPNFTDEAIQDIKERLTGYEETGVVKYYQNVLDVKKENDVLILRSKWKQVKAKDIPIYYNSDNTKVVIGVDKSLIEADPTILIFLGIVNFQPFAIESNLPDNLDGLLIYGGTISDLGEPVNINYFEGKNCIVKLLDTSTKLDMNIETLPRADYIVG